MAGYPFDILGVAPDASLGQVRAAYRNKVLRCHPDTCPDDSAEATRRFTELTAAYKSACRLLDHADEAAPEVRTYTPAELSRMDLVAEEGDDGPMQWRTQPPLQRRVLPTRNETALFVASWVAAMVLAVAVMLAYAPIRARLFGSAKMGAGDAVAVVTASLGVYVAVLIAAVAALVATRKVVWLMVQFGVRLRRLLPAPARDLPNDASQP